MQLVEGDMCGLVPDGADAGAVGADVAGFQFAGVNVTGTCLVEYD